MPRKKKIDAPAEAVKPVPDDASPAKKNVLDARKVQSLYDDARADTSVERLNYWINRAFWLGDQYLWCPDGEKGIIEPVHSSPSKRRDQATENRIQSAMHTTTSRLMKNDLVMEVLAEKADDFTHGGAQKGESLLRQKALDEDWDVLQEKILISLQLGGTAAIVTEWDPTANRYDSETATGDAKLSPLSIEDFVVEPGSLDGKYARWWIRKQILPPQAVQAMFKLDEEPQRDGSSSGPFSAKAFQFSTHLHPKQGTQVLTYFERPNFLRPQGAVLIVVGNKMVWGAKDAAGNVSGPAPWPFPFKDHLNIEVGRCVVDPEKWTGETYVTQAISPQRQYNQLWSKIHEVTHRTAGAKLLVDARHTDAIKNLDDDTEKPVVLNAASGAPAPSYLDFPKLAPHIVQELEKLEEIIDDIMGNHAISQGESPANVESGYGLNILSENDATPGGRLAKEVARMFAGSGTNILKLYADKVKDQRSMVVRNGKNGRPVQWTGKDLAGQTRVIVPPDSTLPRSHAAMLKMSSDLLMKRPDWFPTPLSFFQMAMVPGFEQMGQIADPDTTDAIFENYLMGQGEVVQVNDFDNHTKHIQQHNAERKTPEYRQMDEKTRQLYAAHVAAHQAADAQEKGLAAGLQARNPMLTPAGIPSPAQLPPVAGGPPQAPSENAPPPSPDATGLPPLPGGIQ